VGALPTFVGAQEPELVAVSDDLAGLATPMWLLTHPDLRRTARIRDFMQHVGEAVAQQLSAQDDAHRTRGP
jgi:DNA-binding transcriptional LysR family regulator